MPKKTIGQLIMEYFKAHPKQDLEHGSVVDWVEEQYMKQGGSKPRDIWRNIRSLYEQGKLIKVANGIYRYDPDAVQRYDLLDFPADVKEQIFRRDRYRCVVCGLGREDGVEIHADHKKSRYALSRLSQKGRKLAAWDGQTLCSQHNLLKKRYSMTEAGKKFFANIYEDAIKSNDQGMMRFCVDIFDVYDKHGIDTHISRRRKRSK